MTGGTATNLGGIIQLVGGTFNINGTLTTTNVQMVGGSLTGTNVFTNGFLWSGGDWNTASAVTIAANTVLRIAGSASHGMGNCSLTNNGTVVWSGGDIWGGGVGPGTVIYNQGLWDSQADASLFGAYGGSNIVFHNSGTFRKSAGTNQTTFGYNGVFLNNTGHLDAQTGTITLAAGGNLTGGTATNLAGIIRLAGGAFNINGTLTTTNVQLVAGSLIGVNVVTNGLTWSGGDWNSALAVTIAANTLLRIAGPTIHGMQNVMVTNQGTVVWSGGDIYGGGTSPGTVIYNRGLWDSQADESFFGAYGGNNIVFHNSGTFRKSACAGLTQFGYNGVLLTNTGTLDAQTGTIALAAGGNLSAGTLSCRLNSLTNFGAFNLVSSVAVAGSLNVSINGSFAPAPGNQFQIVKGNNISGSFSPVNVPPGVSVTYSNNGVYLRVTGPVPAHIIGPALVGDNLGFAWATVSGQSYTVQQNTNLATTNWVFYTNLIGDGSLMNLQVPVTNAPQQFFRVREP